MKPQHKTLAELRRNIFAAAIILGAVLFGAIIVEVIFR
jgi:hypothetical protein